MQGAGRATDRPAVALKCPRDCALLLAHGPALCRCPQAAPERQRPQQQQAARDANEGTERAASDGAGSGGGGSGWGSWGALGRLGASLQAAAATAIKDVTDLGESFNQVRRHLPGPCLERHHGWAGRSVKAWLAVQPDAAPAAEALFGLADVAPGSFFAFVLPPLADIASPRACGAPSRRCCKRWQRPRTTRRRAPR